MPLRLARRPKHFLDDGFVIHRGDDDALNRITHFRNYLDTYFDVARTHGLDELISLTLNAGAGLFRIKHQVYRDRALVLTDRRYRFDKYLYLEKDPRNLQALNIRLKKLNRGRNAFVFEGGLAENLDRIRIYTPGSSKGFRSKLLVTGEIHHFDLSFAHLEALMEANGEFLLFFNAPDLPDREVEDYVNRHRDRLHALGGEHLALTGKWNANSVLRAVMQGFMLRMHNAGYTAEGTYHMHGDRLYYTVLCLKRSSRKKIESSLSQKVMQQYDLFT